MTRHRTLSIRKIAEEKRWKNGCLRKALRSEENMTAPHRKE